MTARPAIAGARRIVVKVGSSSLTSEVDGGIDGDRVRAIVDVLAERRGAGIDVVMVSSGAIAAGLAPLGLTRRPRDLATQQAAASVGQGLLVHRYTDEFARHGCTVGQVLLTVDDVVRRSHYRNAQRTLTRLLEMGAVPVVNENDTVATDEIRFGDNDRLAALVAQLIHAEALVLLTDVDGLYDGHPSEAGSRVIADVTGDDDLDGVPLGGVGHRGVGSGGMPTKVEAARIATGAGIPVVLTAADRVGAALAGEPVGTLFHATGRRRATRLLWLAHATTPRGRLVLDDGAVRAVRAGRASLLPAGVVAVEGEFEAGDPVDLVGSDGAPFARGLVNYDAVEIPTLLGRSTSDLLADLGEGYDREIVHRDDLVLL